MYVNNKIAKRVPMTFQILKNPNESKQHFTIQKP